MSSWATERWEAELWLDPQWVIVTKGKPSIVVCVTSHGDDEAKAKAIASDHNACLGIEDPATTAQQVLKLLREVAASGIAVDHPELRYVAIEIRRGTLEAIRDVLARTER